MGDETTSQNQHQASYEDTLNMQEQQRQKESSWKNQLGSNISAPFLTDYKTLGSSKPITSGYMTPQPFNMTQDQAKWLSGSRQPTSWYNYKPYSTRII